MGDRGSVCGLGGLDEVRVASQRRGGGVPLPADHRGDVDAAAIEEFESKVADPGEEAQRRLCRALERGGAVLLPENGGGVGVRLKYARRDVRGVNKWESEGGRAGEDDV